MTDEKRQLSFQAFRHVGLAIDPIHVGTGGARLGRVDNTIVRDPVTRVPKIPGSSLAGVHRAYAAMAYEDERDVQGTRKTPYYPNCAGQGQSDERASDGMSKEHCGESNCPVCAVFGRASFAGLAAFSDAQVLLFPVASREGPVWVTSPSALAQVGASPSVDEANQDKAHRGGAKTSVNLGWLQLEAVAWSGFQKHTEALTLCGLNATTLPPLSIVENLVLVSDKLFGHIVNSNLEVRTSVAINPATGAAEDGALFTYEAIPRGTIVTWEVTCRDPRHFKHVKNGALSDRSPHVTKLDHVHEVAAKAHPFLGALGIGGMGTRGMGRIKVLTSASAPATGTTRGDAK